MPTHASTILPATTSQTCNVDPVLENLPEPTPVCFPGRSYVLEEILSPVNTSHLVLTQMRVDLGLYSWVSLSMSIPISEPGKRLDNPCETCETAFSKKLLGTSALLVVISNKCLTSSNKDASNKEATIYADRWIFDQSMILRRTFRTKPGPWRPSEAPIGHRPASGLSGGP